MSRVTLLSLLSLVLLCACVTPGAGPDVGPVRIGFSGDTGQNGSVEDGDALRGAMLRLKEVNAAGGIDGRPLEIVSIDVRQSAAEAVKGFTRLAEENRVSAVIGTAAANTALAVSPVADLVKVPFVFLGIDDRVTTPELDAGNPDAKGLVRQSVFMVQPSASQLAAAIASFALENFLISRYAIVFDPSSAVSVIQARSFERIVKGMGKLVVASQDFGAPAGKIREAAADALFVCGTAEQGEAFAQALKEAGVTPVLIGNQSWYDPRFLVAAQASEGAWFPAAISPEDPAFKDFSARFEAEFGVKPGPAAAAGWDAVGFVAAAVRKAGSSDPLKIRDAMAGATAFKALVGTFDMDKKTRRTLGQPVSIMRISAGQYRTAEQRYVPKPVAQGQP